MLIHEFLFINSDKLSLYAISEKYAKLYPSNIIRYFGPLKHPETGYQVYRVEIYEKS